MKQFATEFNEDVMAELARPVPQADFGIKVQSVFDDEERGLQGQVATYLNARSVQRRLNDVFGPDGWSFKWELISQTEQKKNNKTEWVVMVKGALTILGNTKEDIGTGDGSDGHKAAVSDALKRAAVHFGIGGYLYDMPKLYWPLTPKKKFKEAERLEENMYELSLEVHRTGGNVSSDVLKKYRYSGSGNQKTQQPKQQAPRPQPTPKPAAQPTASTPQPAASTGAQDITRATLPVINALRNVVAERVGDDNTSAFFKATINRVCAFDELTRTEAHLLTQAALKYDPNAAAAA